MIKHNSTTETQMQELQQAHPVEQFDRIDDDNASKQIRPMLSHCSYSSHH
jgi:hypothetical protein